MPFAAKLAPAVVGLVGLLAIAHNVVQVPWTLAIVLQCFISFSASAIVMIGFCRAQSKFNERNVPPCSMQLSKYLQEFDTMRFVIHVTAILLFMVTI
jgi:hypothetical protein